MSDPLNTIDDAIGEINRRFGQSLPRLADLPTDSFLATLWKLGITTDDNPPAPMVFKACATDREFAFAGNLKGQLIVYVTQGDADAPVTPCPSPPTNPQGGSPMAKVTSLPAAHAPAALAAGSGNTVRFGIVLDLNGSSVPISSGDIANAKANGVEFTLQNPIKLGSIDLFRQWVSDKFSVSLPSADSLPPPLDAVVKTITGMEITVEKAHIKVPGSNDKSGVKFTIETNGAFQPEISLIDGKVGIQGLVFGFSNEPATS